MTIESIISLITQLGVLCVAVKGVLLVLQQMHINHKELVAVQVDASAKTEALHKEINSRMTQLLEVTGQAAHAEGVLAGESNKNIPPKVVNLSDVPKDKKG